MKNQMKKIALVIMIAVGFSAGAQARVVTGPEIKDYADAVIAKLRISECGTDRWFVGNILGAATHLEVTDGSQPLLTFTTYESDRLGLGGNDMIRIVVTTNSTFTELVSTVLTPYVKARVNDGTLMNPIIRDGYRAVESRRGHCY